MRPTLRERVLKPHFVWRPSQVARRLASLVASPWGDAAERVSVLPWGVPLAYDPREHIGSSVARTGVYELTVTELIFRLLDPGEVALDVGANIGYMTAAMAFAAGPEGTIHAFEPHPLLYGALESNVGRWRHDPRLATVLTHAAAVSRSAGRASLTVPGDFASNRGTSSLEGSELAATDERILVPTVALDEILPDATVGLMKVDVEGHEIGVLDGASRLIESGRLRDVLFEEARPLPTPVTERLLASGYSVFALSERLRGPRIGPPGIDVGSAQWQAPTYLATQDPVRAVRRTDPGGWGCLRRRR
jgi:FkbM family methyltransferase